MEIFIFGAFGAEKEHPLVCDRIERQLHRRYGHE